MSNIIVPALLFSVYTQIRFSNERLSSDLCNLEGELNLKMELVVNIFDFPETIGINVYVHLWVVKGF